MSYLFVVNFTKLIRIFSSSRETVSFVYIVIHNKRVNGFKHCICCWDRVAEDEEHMIIPCYPNFDLENVSDNSFERDLGKVTSTLFQFIS